MYEWLVREYIKPLLPAATCRSHPLLHLRWELRLTPTDPDIRTRRPTSPSGTALSFVQRKTARPSPLGPENESSWSVYKRISGRVRRWGAGENVGTGPERERW